MIQRYQGYLACKRLFVPANRGGVQAGVPLLQRYIPQNIFQPKTVFMWVIKRRFPEASKASGAKRACAFSGMCPRFKNLKETE
jgi:hypothetical protein